MVLPHEFNLDMGDGEQPIRVRVHDANLFPEDVTTLDGIPVTTPARTLLDLATCATDIELESALTTAIKRNLTTREEIRTVMARYPDHAGVARLSRLL
jgi:predicted transcriptional regulator of viral defense system